MLTFWRRRRRGDEQLALLRTELLKARHDGELLRIRLALVDQARSKADADALYWRLRAERFLDQIGLRSGVIVEPTMTEPPPSVASHMDTIFGALGHSEIHRDKDSAPGAATTAPTVTGVDLTAARAVVDETLAGVRA